MPTDLPELRPADPAEARKARGAFFTPDEITHHLADWAIRSQADLVLEPSAGEAAFLRSAVRRLVALGADRPQVYGVEMHEWSAAMAEAVVGAAGGRASIEVSDFFVTVARPMFDAVIGNPPFIRYQDFVGESRDRARFAALQQGVALSGLASSWAAFVVHAAAHLKPGGRLAMVLPAELLSVNYASPIRRFLLESFGNVELVVFEEQVFPDAEADTVLVKAEGWRQPSSGSATLRQTRNAHTLDTLEGGSTWAPVDPSDRWLSLPLRPESADALMTATTGSTGFVPLEAYGDTSLGAVTGANRFFALSPERVGRLGIPRRDLVRISPPGSGHLRGLALTESAMTRLGQRGEATWLLYPSARPAQATEAYLSSGEATGVHEAYKCRVRSPWWRVPLLPPPDLFLTYMNADTPRLTANRAQVRHLNSVHGVYLADEYRGTVKQLLPIAALNSLTLLSAELVGRSYGGGILKIEPREADRWLMPSPSLVTTRAAELEAVRPRVQRLLQGRRLAEAVELVDGVLLAAVLSDPAIASVRSDHSDRANRRTLRGRSG